MGRRPWLAGLAVLSILLFVFIVSAALPAWSQSKASAAEAAAGGNPTPASLQSAAAEDTPHHIRRSVN